MNICTSSDCHACASLSSMQGQSVLRACCAKHRGDQLQAAIVCSSSQQSVFVADTLTVIKGSCLRGAGRAPEMRLRASCTGQRGQLHPGLSSAAGPAAPASAAPPAGPSPPAPSVTAARHRRTGLSRMRSGCEGALRMPSLPGSIPCIDRCVKGSIRERVVCGSARELALVYNLTVRHNCESVSGLPTRLLTWASYWPFWTCFSRRTRSSSRCLVATSSCRAALSSAQLQTLQAVSMHAALK